MVRLVPVCVRIMHDANCVQSKWIVANTKLADVTPLFWPFVRQNMADWAGTRKKRCIYALHLTLHSL